VEEAEMQNKLSDLNNHLFSELERLGDEELTGDELAQEISRAFAVTHIAEQIIANGTLALKAANLAVEIGMDAKVPLLLLES